MVTSKVHKEHVTSLQAYLVTVWTQMDLDAGQDSPCDWSNWMLARESNLLLAKMGVVLASYGQCSLEQELGTGNTAPYSDLKKEDKYRKTSLICTPFPTPFSLWEDAIFTDKIPCTPTPKTTEFVPAGSHCTHPREASHAQVTPGVLSNHNESPAYVWGVCLFSSMVRTLFWPSF